MSVNAERFPSVASYVAKLPAGIGSYPECSVKASVYRDALESRPLSQVDLLLLPPQVVELVERPPPVTMWVQETFSNAILIAILDRHFPKGRAGLEAFGEWTYERNRRLLTRPAYRALFLLLNPERLLRNVGSRWEAFRRGTRLELLASGPGWAELVVRHPPHLYSDATLYGLRGAFKAAAEASGGRNVETEARQTKEREARYVVSWQV
jgi:uncharacterized protein (TIGR02265 family)